jgi:colanic acid/amylovoran/stewartan biosynthesis glycosyltransferase WcaL/AmsK/CpsK
VSGLWCVAERIARSAKSGSDSPNQTKNSRRGMLGACRSDAVSVGTGSERDTVRFSAKASALVNRRTRRSVVLEHESRAPLPRSVRGCYGGTVTGARGVAGRAPDPGTMRIAFVLGSFPDTSQTFVLDQLVGLLERGHDVRIFARRPSAVRVEHPGVQQHGLRERSLYWLEGPVSPFKVAWRAARLLLGQPRRSFGPLARSLDVVHNRGVASTSRFFAYATKTLETPRFDVILAHFGTNAVIAERLRRIGALEGPLVSVFHGYDLTRVLGERPPGYYRSVFEHGELLLPVSRRFADKLVELGAPPERIRVHRMGIDLTRFAFRERSIAQGAPIRFVSVCRLVEKKGLEIGMRAMGRARERLGAFEWHIVGEGPLRERLQALAAELGLAQHAVFHGEQATAQVRSVLEQGHVFLAPSVTGADGDQEGIPVAIMEALASGLPVVSTLHSGIPELVRDAEMGYLVAEADDAALADALVRLARQPRAWPSMGARGREHVEREHDAERLNDRLATLLSCVARGEPVPA